MAETISDITSQRNIVTAMLLPGEHIVHIAAISAGIYWKGIAVLIAALVALFYGIWLALYCLAVSAGLLLLAYSTKRYLVLAATDHRVIICGGIINQEVIQLRYHQIESVDILNTPSGSIFGYSSIIITGTGTTRWMIPFIRDAIAFRDNLTQKLLESEAPMEHKAA